MCPLSNGMSKVLAYKGIVVLTKMDKNLKTKDRFFKFQCSSFLLILTWP